MTFFFNIKHIYTIPILLSDINECRDNNRCDRDECVNTYGSYYCIRGVVGGKFTRTLQGSIWLGEEIRSIKSHRNLLIYFPVYWYYLMSM